MSGRIAPFSKPAFGGLFADDVGGLGDPPDTPRAALEELRQACPAALAIVLMSHLDARRQAALSAGADVFISKGEMPERVAEHLRNVAANLIGSKPGG